MPQSSAVPTIATLRRPVGEAAVARGQAYAHNGTGSLHHALDRDGRLAAQVQGTHARLYALTARLVGDGRAGSRVSPARATAPSAVAASTSRPRGSRCCATRRPTPPPVRDRLLYVLDTNDIAALFRPIGV